jgi:AraC-like DNA-binding protein
VTDTVPQFAVSAPAPALRAYVSHYAGGRAEGLTPCTHAGLPSRHAHLIVGLDEPIEVLRSPDPRQAPGRFRALVCGLHADPALVRMGTRVHLVHVFLTPLGVRAILGASNPELASRVVELSDLWGDRGRELVEGLWSNPSWSARFALLDEVFTRAVRPHAFSAPAAWAWQRLAASAGGLPITALARDIGWSRAHLTERFRTAFGLGPKTAARIFRFEHACRALKTDPRRIAAVAHACGYHDQAHMTREWRALAGSSPREWIAAELPFVQDYELPPGEDRLA